MVLIRVVLVLLVFFVAGVADGSRAVAQTPVPHDIVFVPGTPLEIPLKASDAVEGTPTASDMTTTSSPTATEPAGTIVPIWIMTRADDPAVVTVQLLVERLAPTSMPLMATRVQEEGVLLRFDLDVGGIKPLKPGTYTGTLVASGEGLEPAFRSVTLRVEGAPASGGLVLPNGGDAIDMQATNLWPSVLNPLSESGWDALPWWVGLLLVLWLLIAAFYFFIVVRFGGSVEAAQDRSLQPGGRARQASVSSSSMLRRALAKLANPRPGQVLLTLLLAAVVVGLIGLLVNGRTPTLSRVEGPAYVLAGTPRATEIITVADDGGVAKINITGNGGALEVASAPRAGTYQAHVQVRSDDDVNPKPLTLKVRDAWPWAVLTVTIGVLIANEFSRYVTNVKPAMTSRAVASELRVEVENKDREFKNQHVGKPYRNYTMLPYALKELDEVEKLINEGAVEGDKGATKKLETLSGHLASFETVRADLAMLNLLVVNSGTLVQEIYGIDKPIAAGVLAQPILKGTTTGRPFGEMTPEVLARVQNELSASLAWNRAIYNALEVISDYYENSDDSKKEPIQTAALQVLSAVEEDVAKHLGKVTDVYNGHPADSSGSTPKSTSARGIVPFVDSGEGTAAAGGGLPHITIQFPEHERLRAQLALTDSQLAWLAGALAVASGFTLLYFASDTWGTPQDYLTAVLWGSVVTEAVKQISKLAANIKIPGLT